MAGWHHRYNGHELGQTLGDGEGQRGLVCCSPWGCKGLDVTGRLNNSKNQRCNLHKQKIPMLDIKWGDHASPCPGQILFMPVVLL